MVAKDYPQPNIVHDVDAAIGNMLRLDAILPCKGQGIISIRAWLKSRVNVEEEFF